MMKKTATLLALLAVMTATSAYAETYQLSLKDHQFTPATLQVEPYRKAKITVRNLDTTPAELGSTTLDVEPTIVEPGQAVTITIPALQPGQSHMLLDVFHNDTECYIVTK